MKLASRCFLVSALAFGFAPTALPRPGAPDSDTKVRIVNLSQSRPDFLFACSGAAGLKTAIPAPPFGQVSPYYSVEPGRHEWNLFSPQGKPFFGKGGNVSFDESGRLTLFVVDRLASDPFIAPPLLSDTCWVHDERLDGTTDRQARGAFRKAQLRIVHFGSIPSPRVNSDENRLSCHVFLNGVQQRVPLQMGENVYLVLPGLCRVTLKESQHDAIFMDAVIPLRADVRTTLVVLDDGPASSVVYRFDEERDHSLRWTATL